MKNWYVIADIDDFVTAARKLVFNTFGQADEETQDVEQALTTIKPENQEEFDSVLTQEESVVITKNLARKQINKKTNEKRYLINEHLMLSIVEALNDRMTSNLLNSLVNRGIIESAYDNESNDFVFWVKEENEKENKKKRRID